MHIPADLAHEFEAMGEPVVAHRLTRFTDARVRAAAQDWLAELQAKREAASHAAEAVVELRGRRITVALAVATVIGWAVALTILLL